MCRGTSLFGLGKVSESFLKVQAMEASEAETQMQAANTAAMATRSGVRGVNAAE